MDQASPNAPISALSTGTLQARYRLSNRYSTRASLLRNGPTTPVRIPVASSIRSSARAPNTANRSLVADRVEKGTVKQVFWLDTANSFDLVRGDVPYKTGITLFLVLPRKAYDQAPKDNGDCKAMMGSECLEALIEQIHTGPCEEDYISGSTRMQRPIPDHIGVPGNP